MGLRRAGVGEDTQADIPRISDVKLRFFRSRRNTIGRSSSPYRPHRSLPHVALVRPYSLDVLCQPGGEASKKSTSSGTGSGRSTVQHPEPMVEVFGCEARRSPIDLAEHDVE